MGPHQRGRNASVDRGDIFSCNAFGFFLIVALRTARKEGKITEVQAKVAWLALCNTVSRPHAAVRTRRGFKIAGLVTVALIALGLWMVPIQEFGDDAWIVWIVRIGLLLAAAALVVWIVRQPREPSFNQRLAAVKPIEGWTCPFCGGQLLNLPTWHCPSCRVEHRPLSVRGA